MKSEPSSNIPDSRESKTYYFHITPTRYIITKAIQFAFFFISKCRYEGVENLPESGPVIIAANHMTNFDVFPIQFAMPRPIFFMGKEQLFRNPVLDWFLRQLGSFPVYRGARDTWALSHAQRVLDKEQILGMFPEGTRNKGKGLRLAKTGAAHLAINTNCPIVPVAVHGSQYLFRRFPKRTKISINIGSPIHPQAGESTLGLTDRVMFTLASMLPIESRGAYRFRPPGF